MKKSKAQSTDARDSDGLSCSSEDVPVMGAVLATTYFRAYSPLSDRMTQPGFPGHGHLSGAGADPLTHTVH